MQADIIQKKIHSIHLILAIITPSILVLLILAIWFTIQLSVCSNTFCFGIDFSSLVPDTSSIITSVTEDLKMHQQAENEQLLLQLVKTYAEIVKLKDSVEECKLLLIN